MLRIAAPLVSSRIPLGAVRAIVIIAVAMCSFGGHALGARATIAQPSSSPVLIAAGASHSIAVTSSGQVWTWGDNRVGQLGTGDTTSHAAPVPVAGLGNEFISVSAGLGHSLALDYLGRVWSWGLNSDGQLGDATRTRRLAPVLVAQASDVVAIAAGSVHSLALRSDGTVLAWGGNLGAQLGDGTNSGRTRPVVITGLTDVIAIAAGTAHSLALRSDGSVWAWGTNLTGQLGLGSTLLKRRPTHVTSLSGIAAIAAGVGHSVAVSSTGAVWAWGWNSFGQLGDGTRTTRRTPIAIQGVAEVSRISAGATHTLAATGSGELFAWGGNGAGQIGDGSTLDRLVPTLVPPPPSQVIDVAAGAVHSLLLAADVSAWSWGNNYFGQLGEGSHVGARRPTPISGPDQAWGVAPPTFSPEGGTYDGPIEVAISTNTANAVIHYTTNGDDPTESDPVADAPLLVEQTTILNARAFKAGMTESAVSTAEYVFAGAEPPAAPTFSLEGGFFSAPIDVEIFTSTAGAEIRYTLDGSEPQIASELYVAPLHVTTQTTIKARAFLDGLGSDTSAVLYLFDFGRAATPVATPGAGMYEQLQHVTLTAQPGASIYFTLDGSVPSEASTLYVSPVAIAANLTLSARAVHPDYSPSRVLTADYVIDNTPTGLPVDPSTVAPPVDPTEPTDFAESTAFLYTGPNRVQRFVTPGAIVPERVTVLRGKVHDRAGNPVSGIRIGLLNEPAIGYTLTRLDGMFDLAVNGGGRVTIEYTGEGYLPAQRTISTGWNDFVSAPDVVLTALDPQVTVVTLASSEAQAARGTPVTDDAGTRQATLIIPEGGVVANIELADGTLLPAVSQLSIRATEYTVGPNGRAAMPGDLPNTSGYTYAVELSADEAIVAQATRVTFDRPLPFYVENFLGFPVGGAVPTGYYDRTRAEWVPSDNGRIVGIVSETDGAANLDLNGDGLVDDAAALTLLGVTDGERRRLAVLYEPGQSLWRVPIPHFTPWDHNWPFGPPPDADYPNVPPPDVRDHVNDGCVQRRSIVECESQVLGERVAVGGTPFTLNYRSNRQPGNTAAVSTNVPLTGAAMSPSLKRIDLEVSVAGQQFVRTFTPQANASTNFDWDGRDVYGRPIYGARSATVVVKHVYDGVYRTPGQSSRSFGIPSTGAIIGNRERVEVSFEQSSVVAVRGALAPAASVGGWTLDQHHWFDRAGNTLWMGDGTRRDAEPSTYDIKPWGANAGNGLMLNGTLPDGTALVTSNTMGGPTGVGRDGSLGGVFMGQLPSACQSSRSGEAMSLAVGAGGQLYYALTNIAFGATGNATRLCIGITRPGQDAENFATIQLPQAQYLARGLLALDTSGVIYAAAGRYLYQLNPGGSPVLVYTAPGGIEGISLMPNGDLVMVTSSVAGFIGQLRRLSPSGEVTLIAGALTGGSCGAPRADGPIDPTVVMCPTAVAAMKDRSLIYTDRDEDGFMVRRLWPDGFVTTVARSPQSISDLAIVQDDEIYATDGKLKRLVPALAEDVAGPAMMTSADGSQLFAFSAGGRHERTTDAVTGLVLYSFGYDPQGHLVSITDRNNLTTTIERTSAGVPQAIVGPHGQRTSLQVNADGYLSSITDPLGGATALDYRAGGLLTMFRTPNGDPSHFDYDTVGRLISDRDAAGGELTLTRTELAGGWSVVTEDNLGRRERYTVEEEAPGQFVRTKESADGTISTSATLADGTTEQVAPDGTRTRVTMASDPRFGRQAQYPSSSTTTTPSGLALTTTVTRSVENVLFSNPPEVRSIQEITSINGRQSSTVFDKPTRTITTTSPANRRVVTTLDAKGRPASLQFGNTVLPTTFTYDAQGRLATQTQGVRTMTFTYDERGYLGSVTDPLPRTVEFTNDLGGRRTAQTFPDLSEATFAYDPNGNLTALTPPGRPAHTMAYTPANLLETYTAPSVGSPTVTRYQFNVAKQPTSVTRADGQQIAWLYDGAGRPQTTTTPTGVTTLGYHPITGQLASLGSASGELAYSYDGRLQTAEAASGFTAGVVSWNYDTSFRITTERINGANPIAFTYDADSLLTGAGAVSYTRRADDGLLLTATLGSAVTTFTYSNFAEVATEETRQDGTLLYGGAYTRDNVGRLTQRSETIGGTTTTDTYSYDPAGRLASVTRSALLTTYSYDANGNRTSVTTGPSTIEATYDDQDRILALGDRTYTHTPHGEVRSWTGSSGTTTLTYDVQGNLLAVHLPGTTVEYLVDARNRRIGRKVDGTVTHRWLYQGQQRPVAELDSSGGIVSRFVYGARAAAPEYLIRGTATYRLITDHLGSVRLVVNTATGEVAQRLEYDASGQVVNDTAPGFQPFGYAGGLFDPVTSLVRFGVRDYDPVSATWMSQDPILSGTNFYRYGDGDPINRVDRNGMYGREVHYDLTYDLAVKAGLLNAEAYFIALGNQGTDDNPETNPFWSYEARVKYHFTDAQQLEKLKKAAFNGCDDVATLMAFGQYLHALQDSYSHQRGRNSRNGEPFGPLFGHIWTKAPDIPSRRPALYRDMYRHTVTEIAAFKAQMGAR